MTPWLFRIKLKGVFGAAKKEVASAGLACNWVYAMYVSQTHLYPIILLWTVRGVDPW